jgi:hypothetical protein
MKTATTWFDKKQWEFENFHQIEIVHRAIQEPDPSLENVSSPIAYTQFNTRPY